MESLPEMTNKVTTLVRATGIEDPGRMSGAEPSSILCALPLLGRMARCRAGTTRTPRPGAVRLVREHRDDYDSEWAAMKAIAGRLGMSAETLRK